MARRPGTTTHAYGSDPIIVAYGVGVDSTAMSVENRYFNLAPAVQGRLHWRPKTINLVPKSTLASSMALQSR